MTTVSNADLRTYMGVIMTTINSNFKKSKQNIPSISSTVSASSTNAEAVGAKLFYDTVGNIETLLQGV